eukprot:g40556.t1
MPATRTTNGDIMPTLTAPGPAKRVEESVSKRLEVSVDFPKRRILKRKIATRGVNIQWTDAYPQPTVTGSEHLCNAAENASTTRSLRHGGWSDVMIAAALQYAEVKVSLMISVPCKS